MSFGKVFVYCLDFLVVILVTGFVKRKKEFLKVKGLKVILFLELYWFKRGMKK